VYLTSNSEAVFDGVVVAQLVVCQQTLVRFLVEEALVNQHLLASVDQSVQLVAQSVQLVVADAFTRTILVLFFLCLRQSWMELSKGEVFEVMTYLIHTNPRNVIVKPAHY
jgi:hypothetical protein